MQIEVNGLSYVYSEGLPFEQTALKDISFTIPEGSFTAIIGHTGSGKSTLVQHLNGLIKPQCGSVKIGDLDAASDGAAIRRKVGLVFQYPEYQLFEETVLKDVEFGPNNLGLDAEEEAKKALDLVGISEDKYEVSPFALSGGEKRRVAIAGVLAMNPEVLILDEPASGLDPKGHRDIMDMIRRIKEERGISVVLVSHNMEDVAELADQLLVMHNGELVMQGAPAEIFIHCDALESLGLSSPAGVRFLKSLKDKGFGDIKINKLTMDETADEIARVFRGKQK